MDENKELPVWYDGKKVNEVLFCQEFLRVHPMVCVKGSFFSVDHRITDERELRKRIYDMLRSYDRSGVAKHVDGLVEVLRSEAYLEDLPVQADRIHVANGTLFLGGGFTEEKTFCRNRLPVCYDPAAMPPLRWLQSARGMRPSEKRRIRHP